MSAHDSRFPKLLVVLSLSALAVGCGHSSGHSAATTAAGPTGGTTQTPGGVDHVAYGLSLINGARAARGARALELDSGLSAVALRHSTNLAASTALIGFAASAHKDFNAGDTGGAKAENQGFQGPGDEDANFKFIFDAMMAEGPPPAGTDNHYSTLMNPAARFIGIGDYYDSTRTLWVTEDFK